MQEFFNYVSDIGFARQTLTETIGLCDVKHTMKQYFRVSPGKAASELSQTNTDWTFWASHWSAGSDKAQEAQLELLQRIHSQH